MRDIKDVVRSHWKILLSAYIGIVVIAVVLSVSVSIARRSRHNAVEQDEFRLTGLEQAGPPTELPMFILPPDPDIFPTDPALFRTPGSRWSEADSRILWYDPGSIGADHLREINARDLRAFFQEIR
jgi:hypothetical protein